MLQCLDTFAYDNNRNEYVDSISPFIKSIQGDDFVNALRQYSYDNGRNDFVTRVIHHVIDVNYYLLECLGTYRYDIGREDFLKIYCKYYAVDPTDFGKINQSFKYGFKQFGILVSKNTKVKPLSHVDITDPNPFPSPPPYDSSPPPYDYNAPPSYESGIEEKVCC